MLEMEKMFWINRFDILEQQISELARLVKLAIPQEILQAKNQMDHEIINFKREQEENKI